MLRLQNRIFIFYIFVFSLLLGCTPNSLKEKELIKYISQSSNGLSKEVTLEDVKLKVIFRPSSLIEQQQRKLEKNQIIDTSFKNKYCFVLHIAKHEHDLETYYHGIRDDMNYRISWLALDMNQYMFAITSNNDTIPVENYTFQRMYGYTGYTSFMMVYPRKDLDMYPSFDICILDFDLDLNLVKFRFQLTDIQKIPTLKIE